MCPNKRYRGECDREEKQGAERGRNQQKNRPMLNRKTRRIRRKIRGSTSARKQSKIEQSSLSPSVSPLCSCPFIPSLNSAGQRLRDSSVGYPYFTLVHAQYGEHTSVYSYTRRRSNVHSAQAIRPRMAILSCFAYKAPPQTSFETPTLPLSESRPLWKPYILFCFLKCKCNSNLYFLLLSALYLL